MPIKIFKIRIAWNRIRMNATRHGSRKIKPNVRIELTTSALQVRCSATKLIRLKIKGAILLPFLWGNVGRMGLSNTPWKTWASIPLPLACKASALPFELDSQNKNAPSGNRNRGTSLEGTYVTTTPMVLGAAAGIEPTTSSTQRKNHTPRPSGRANTEDRTQHLSRVKGAS